MQKHPHESPILEAGLYLVATPIGNLADITERAKFVLKNATEIWAEDTRNTKKLLNLLDIPLDGRPMRTNHDHNEAGNIERLHASVANNAAIALVSDAGMPVISDPGFRLVGEAQKSGYYVTVLPGASAVTTALALSGAPSDRFAFYGFAPNKTAKRENYYQDIARNQMTAIVFESPKRVNKSLAAIRDAYPPNTQTSVIRELTKKFETHIRGDIAMLVDEHADTEWRGEIVIVIDPIVANELDGDELDRLLLAALDEMRLNDAVRTVAKETGQNKNDVYERALQLKNKN